MSDDSRDAPLNAPGWQALDIRFSSIYPGALPHQFTSATPYDFDSRHPLPAITVWEAPAQGDTPPFWHFVSYGLTELFEKTTSDPEHSGLGYELTLAVPRQAQEQRPPDWGLSLLQGIAGHVLPGELTLDTGSTVALGQALQGGPEREDRPSGCVCVPDPVAGVMQGPFGRILFLRLLGLCQDELELCQSMELAPKIDMVAELSPQAITQPDRAPWASDEQRAKVLRRYRLGIRW